MPGELLVLDPVTEDASNIELPLNDGVKFRAMEHEYPPPPRGINWSSSADTEGEEVGGIRYQNRTITIKVRVYGSSLEDLFTQLGYLEQKMGRLERKEPMTLKRTTASGQVYVFDLRDGEANVTQNNSMLATNRAEVAITFTAKPLARGAEGEGVLHTETTKPCLVFTELGPKGDAAALGRLVMTEAQGVDQWSLIWGVQSRYYDPSVDAELFYEAESRTPQGGAETKELAGASGLSKNTVFQGGLKSAYISMLSTQKASAGNHLSNIGTFRVFGRFQRPTSNSGEVSVALEWAQGDFRLTTQNEAKTWKKDELEGVFTLVDLGLVHLIKVTAGMQRWEGRILAKSTSTGDDIYCDYLMLVPVDEGYGELVVDPPEIAPTALTAHDEFEQPEGNLEGKALPSGQVWTETNRTGANGFKVAGGLCKRTIASDANLNSGCFAQAGSISYGRFVAAVELAMQLTTNLRAGILSRYVSTEKWLIAVVNGTEELQVIKNVGGTVTVLASASTRAPGEAGIELPEGFVPFYIQLAMSENGIWQATCGAASLSGHDADLAAGGVLATGKIGLYDVHAGTGEVTRRFDNFWFAEAAAADAALYANRQAEVRWDRMQRQDSAGGLMVPRSDYRGTYLKVPPAGREGRSARFIVKACRGDYRWMADSAIDDLSGRLFTQPRLLTVPEP